MDNKTKTKKDTGKKPLMSRFFKMLVDAKWFYTFTASATATIVGISLTFGLNSSRENHRKKSEAKESVMQAIDNISDRTAQAIQWRDELEAQYGIYVTADSIYRTGTEIPDSVCLQFSARMPVLQVFLSDHEFEKIFRGSYQIWQILDQDRLRDNINGCYEMLNYIEPLCKEMNESMLTQITECNDNTPLGELDTRGFTEMMLARPQFRYFMSLRKGRIQLVDRLVEILEETLSESKSMCDELGYQQPDD